MTKYEMSSYLCMYYHNDAKDMYFTTYLNNIMHYHNPSKNPAVSMAAYESEPAVRVTALPFTVRPTPGQPQNQTQP